MERIRLLSSPGKTVVRLEKQGIFKIWFVKKRAKFVGARDSHFHHAADQANAMYDQDHARKILVGR